MSGPEKQGLSQDLSHVLDADPDLGAGLDGDSFEAARQQAVARLMAIEPGPGDLPAGDVGAGGYALVLEGVLAREVSAGERTSAELLGPGDVLRPWGQDDSLLLPTEVSWEVLSPARLALLDQPFVERIRDWPEIADALLRRSIQRAQALAVQRAIAAHKRLDHRIIMLLWHLAERWGHVGPDASVRIHLPLTHRLLGLVVGAERPSVSTALGRLATAGLLTRDGDDWTLHGAMDDQLSIVGEGAVPNGGSPNWSG